MKNNSFIEDEDGDAFQVKKSSFSRKIHKERNKKHKSKTSSSNDSQNSNLNSLRESNNSSSPPSSTKLTTTAKESNYVKEIHSDDGFSVRLLLSIL